MPGTAVVVVAPPTVLVIRVRLSFARQVAFADCDGELTKNVWSSESNAFRFSFHSK